MEKGQKSLASRGLWQLPLGEVIRPAATVKIRARRDPSGDPYDEYRDEYRA